MASGETHSCCGDRTHHSTRVDPRCNTEMALDAATRLQRSLLDDPVSAVGIVCRGLLCCISVPLDQSSLRGEKQGHCSWRWFGKRVCARRETRYPDDSNGFETGHGGRGCSRRSVVWAHVLRAMGYLSPLSLWRITALKPLGRRRRGCRRRPQCVHRRERLQPSKALLDAPLGSSLAPFRQLMVVPLTPRGSGRPKRSSLSQSAVLTTSPCAKVAASVDERVMKVSPLAGGQVEALERRNKS